MTTANSIPVYELAELTVDFRMHAAGVLPTDCRPVWTRDEFATVYNGKVQKYTLTVQMDDGEWRVAHGRRYGRFGDLEWIATSVHMPDGEEILVRETGGSRVGADHEIMKRRSVADCVAEACRFTMTEVS